MEPYKDPSLPIDKRVEDLLSRMTLREKVAQMHHLWKNSDVPRDKFNEPILEEYGETGFGAAYVFWVSDRNALQKHMVENTRLGIPVSFVTEALHGGAANGTIFPMPLAMAASWNTDLLARVYTHIAKEARMSGANQTFSPNIDIATDPRFGRVDEGYGEDPHLASVCTDIAVRSLQGEGDSIDESHIAATVKHFAAYGMAENGQDGGAADLSEQQLRERYLPPLQGGGRRRCEGYHARAQRD